jgi:hypothetical protein
MPERDTVEGSMSESRPRDELIAEWWADALRQVVWLTLDGKPVDPADVSETAHADRSREN